MRWTSKAVQVGILGCLCVVWLDASGFAQSQGLGVIPRVSQPSSFAERFALADDRNALLTELIPETEEFFYYHTLHAQNESRIADARGFLDAWIGKIGETGLAKQMLTRQMLLEYPKQGRATLEYIQREFGIQVSHPSPQRDEAAELPTSLAPNVFDWNEIVNSWMKVPGGIGQIEDALLPHVLSKVANIQDLRIWISRIRRSDVPKLVDRLVEELLAQDSQGFGWAPIHRELTVAQLQALREKIPTLAQSGAFVHELVRRTRPSDDQSIQDPETRGAHLAKLEELVVGLPEVHNSLIAAVLYQRLALDEKLGVMDRERFLRYLQLPSHRPICAPEFMRRNEGRPHVDFSANFPVDATLRPIGDDVPLVARYLEHFFQADKDYKEFAKYLNSDYLRKIFAMTKILYGIGDIKAYYSQLGAEEQRELASRIEVKFLPTNASFYRPTDRVRVELELKNTPELLVRIYRLNARNILRRQSTPISTAIDLDGVVANMERRFEYGQKSDRRHRESIELPELAGTGVWVVECLAGGQRSRALIQKGHLQTIQTTSYAGHLIKIVNADGATVPSARILLGEREFSPDESGVILIPYDDATRLKSIVLVDENFAVMEQFNHLGESNELRASFLVEPQSILSGSRSAIVVRPRLLSHGRPIPLDELKEVELAVTSTDIEGISSTQVFSNLKLTEANELVQSFLVPPRLWTLEWTLRGKLLSLRTNTEQLLEAKHRVSVNEIAKTGHVHDFYLSRTDQGYSLELRGRNGEPHARVAVQLEVKMVGTAGIRSVRLASDALGVIGLGPMAGVERFWVSGAGMPRREFDLRKTQSDWPERVHALAGEEIRLPATIIEPADRLQWVGGDAVTLNSQRFTLMEVRGGIPCNDRSDRVALEGGGIRITQLEAGNYSLTDHRTRATCALWVASGDERDGMLVGKTRTLWRSYYDPIRIEKIEADGSKIRIHVAGDLELGRVHVWGTAYEHPVSEGWQGPSYRVDSPAIERNRQLSFYVDSMQLDEEYQYVLARQLSKPILGSLLPHPSVLLNPWELSATRNESREAQAGDAIIEQMQASNAPAPSPRGVDPSSSTVAPDLSRDYEFLQRASLIVPNLKSDKNGIIELDREAFEGLTHVSVVAVHPTMTSSRRIGLPMSKERMLRDRRLPQSLELQQHFSQKDSVIAYSGGERLDLGDVGMTKIRMYASIGEVMPMLQGILGDPSEFRKFDFLKGWSGLSDAQKMDRYNEMACHELHLFLKFHDSMFFEKVVRPHLESKMPKQFMDDWLLDRDLATYTEPWKWMQLNAAERVLLAKRIEAKRPGTLRWLQDQLAANPIPPQIQGMWFAQSLRSSLLITEFAAGETADGLMGENGQDKSRFMMEERLGEGSRYGGMGGGMGGAGGSSGGRGGAGFGNRTDNKRVAGDLAGKPGSMPGSSGKDAFYDSFGVEQEALAREDAGRWKAENGALDALSRSDEAKFAKKEKGSEADEDFKLGQVLSRRGLDRVGAYRQADLFKRLETTKKWAESQYYRVPLENQIASLIQPSPYWLDYLKYTEGDSFLSEHLHLAARNTNEALMALALLGLPLEPQAGTLEIEEGRWVLKKSDRCLVYLQGIVPVEASKEPATLLLSENVYLASEDNTAKAVDRQTLVAGVPYRDRVVMTNPTGNGVRIQILMQIPQGAIALEGGRTVTVKELELAPFTTQEVSHVFYFPIAGEFTCYGARASSDGKIVAHQDSSKLKVLERPAVVDDSSWAYIASWGSNEQALAALEKVNFAKNDLNAIAWRMRDKDFWETALNRLEQLGVYHDTLWGYALLHDNPKRIREYLEASERIVAHVGPVFRSDLLTADVESRLKYEHLDFRPLVVARSHRLGREHVILNDGMASKYRQLMQILSYRAKPLSRQRLSVIYYLIAQNRIEEAIEHFARVSRVELRESSEGSIQYDYFDAYLGMRTGSFERSNEIASRYLDYPVPRWREWFVLIHDQVRARDARIQSDVATKDTGVERPLDPSQRTLNDAREREMERSAAILPSLDIVREEGVVWFEFKNVDNVRFNYYLMDVELMFSRNPFMPASSSVQAVIEPNRTELVAVESSGKVVRKRWEVPAELANKNLVVEVIAGGLVRSLPIYSNSLSVDMSTSLGRLQVASAGEKEGGGRRPVGGAYVKVYAKHQDGKVRFFKDGYTDLRGEFDYATLSTPDLETAVRLSVLVLHPDYGAWIRECDPPTKSNP
jgi:hypothetical protein